MAIPLLEIYPPEMFGLVQNDVQVIHCGMKEQDIGNDLDAFE